MSALLGYILGEWIFVVNHRLHQRASIGHLIWEQKAKAKFKRVVPSSHAWKPVAPKEEMA